MKKTFIAALAALTLFGCTQQQKNTEPTVFEGRFIGYADEYVEFFLLGEGGNYIEVPISIAEDGTFCDTLTFGTVYDCALFADKFMFRVSIEEGKHYTAEFDLTTGREVDFRFFGEGEKENQFLSHYWEEYCTIEALLNKVSDCDTYESYMDGIDAVANSLEAELLAIPNKAFVAYYTPEFNRVKSTYVNYYPLIRVNAAGTYRPEQSYLKALKSAPKLNDKQYSQMLAGVCGYAPYLWPNLNLREALRAAADYSDNKTRKEQAISSLIEAFVDAGCNGKLEDAYAYYKENVKNPDVKLCEKIENAMTLGPGAQAPEIEFQDIDGNVFHLADFQGKPLYIDLWASWCGPCCAEIPHLQKLVNELGADPEIVCISMSIDDNRDDWTAKLAEENSTWPQYLATANGMTAISKDYGVSGIPRFMLINPDGTIASVNAPRPSDANIIESLKSLL